MKKGTKNKGTTISACLMVRDEEKNLPRCLKSIVPYVDEIIVVDTGSKDKTMNIARSFGASVYEHKWERDFSKHRNQSISYATKEWVLIIDADEELIMTNPKRFKMFIEKLYKNKNFASALLIRDIQRKKNVMSFNSARLFKNGEVHYRSSVHNQPKITGKGSIFCPFAHIRHYGYDLTDEQRAKKTIRTSSLLFERLKKDPKDYVCYFYLAQLYAVNRDRKKCLEYGEKYLSFKDKLKDGFNNSIYFTIFHNYMLEKDIKNASKILNAGLKIIPDDLDLNHALSEFGIATKRMDLMQTGVRRFIYLYERYNKNPQLRGNRFIYSHNPMALAYCIYHLIVFDLKEGTSGLNMMMNVLNNTPKRFKNSVLENFKKEMDHSKIPIQIIQNKKNYVTKSFKMEE